MMKPKSFILYPNQWEPLSCLSDEQLGRLFRHIFCWLNDESLDLQKEEQLVGSDILLAFRFMRMQINIDLEKTSIIMLCLNKIYNLLFSYNTPTSLIPNMLMHLKNVLIF